MVEPMSTLGRNTGLDLARFVAVVTMIVQHTKSLNQDMAGHGVLLALTDGRAAPLFTFVAGVTLTAVSRVDSVRGWLTKILALAVLGLLLGATGTTAAVILIYFAFFYAVTRPMVRLGLVPLAAIAVGCVGLAPVLSSLAQRRLQDVTASNLGLGHAPSVWLGELVVHGYYPAVVFLSFFIAGMAIGRLDLRPGRTSVLLLCVGSALVVAAYATRAVVRLAVGAELGTPASLRETGIGCLVLGVSLLAGRSRCRAMLAPLACAGSMTLTAYCLHVLGLTPAALALLPAGWLLIAVHVTLAVLVSVLWRRSLGRGPLETVIARCAGADRAVADGP